EVEAAVDLRLLAERPHVLAEVEAEVGAGLEVGERALGRHALAEHLDADAHRVDLGLLRILRHLGEPAADPEILDAVHDDGLELARPAEPRLAALDLDRRRDELLPALPVPVLPLEEAGHVAAAVVRAAEVDAEHGLVAEADEARVAEVEVTLGALGAAEDLEA